MDVEEDARQVPLRRSTAGGGGGRGRDYGGGVGSVGSQELERGGKWSRREVVTQKFVFCGVMKD